ncbi:MAG: histidine kinase dimerization/phospho-acceptor domain-containing protein [Erythrobacter sp.]
MFFDDRLATVLRHRATSERAARTQFRQLLDLLGNRKYGRDDSLLAAAWLRLGALGEQIPAAERARMIREPGWRFRNPQLAAHLAEDEPEVVAAALSRADLEEGDWVALIPRLPIRARGFLRLQRDLPPGAQELLERLGIHDRGLPDPTRVAIELDIEVDVRPAPLDLSDDFEAPPIPPSEPEPEAAPTQGEAPVRRPRPVPPTPGTSDEKSEIAALVERIAQFRRDRGSEPAASDLSPRLPLGEHAAVPDPAIAGFGFGCDASGRIEWADPEVAPMVVGQRLFDRSSGDAGVLAAPIAAAFAQQQPIEGLIRQLEGAQAIRGEWVVDAHPRFSTTGGRFHGYVGRFRRPFDPGRLGAGEPSQADRIRQMLHELRTPVNAVQGFAELIHQQLYGPVPNAYRALAATIAGDAASILAGFDELERLAKLESGALSLGGGKTDLLDLARRMTNQLSQVLAPRMAGIDLAEGPERGLWVEIDPDEAEALAWRMLATLAGAVTAGEVLAAEIEMDQDRARLWCQIPAQLIAEDDVFTAEIKPGTSGLNSGLFGAGFSLRLARAEARGAGGDLQQVEERMCLSLPLTAVALGERPEESARGSDAG